MKKAIYNSFNPKGEEYDDSGFSHQANNQSSRLLDEKGEFNVIRTGLGRFQNTSLVHELVSMSWVQIISFFFIIYLTVISLYAVFYFFIGINHFGGMEAGTNLVEFKGAFFFSAQTLTLAGFGRINPIGFSANAVANLEAVSGLLIFAFAVGLIYIRLSRPMFRLKFSEKALISPYRNGLALMFRLANTKSNDLSQVNCQILVSVLIYEADKFVRKYYDLQLERKEVNALILSWTIVHPIDENSPFWGLDAQACEECELEILITINGFDTSFSQQVQTRYFYDFSEIEWNARFLPTFKRGGNGNFTILEMDKLGSFEYLKPLN